MKSLEGNTIKLILYLLGALICGVLSAQTTSWTGTDDDKWRNASNWTNGVPDENTDVVIGDANFTGSFEPTLKKGKGNGDCNDLTLGNGGTPVTLTTKDRLEISGDLTIGTNGTLVHDQNNLYVSGDFENNGSYVPDDQNRRVYMFGSGNTLGGSSTTTFGKLYIHSGSYITLAGNIEVENFLDLTGTFDPTQDYSVGGSGEIDMRAGAWLVIKASSFGDNYPITGGIDFRSNSTVVEYGSSTINQTIDENLEYTSLLISGGLIKSLSGNTSVSRNLFIDGGTLDIGDFNIDRSKNGGYLVISADATLRIGGTQSFPSNYNNHTIASTSTVEYYGGNQAISDESYGNLILSSSNGAVVKTMPATVMTVLGNLTTSASAGTLSYTAGEQIEVFGTVNIGSNTTFNGSTYQHAFWEDFINNGTFSGSSGTLVSNGGNNSWSGSGSFDIGDFNINAAHLTLDQNSSLSISGHFLTGTGGSFEHATGGSGEVSFSSDGELVGGALTFDDLVVEAGASIIPSSTFTIGGDLTIDGTMSAAATNHIILSGMGKTILVTGALGLEDLTVTGTLSTTSDFTISGNLLVLGSLSATAGMVTFDGTTDLSGTASLFNVTVDNGSVLSMGVESTLNIAGTDALVGTGSFDGISNAPNTVIYNSSGAQTITFSAFHHLSTSDGGIKASAAALTINGDLTIGSGTTFTGSSFTHTLQGNWINNGTFTDATSTFQLTGSENTSISGETTFNGLTVNKSSTNVVTINDNVSATTLNVNSGIIQTGTNSLTITSSRTGNGIILGTIIRQHAFTTSIDYSFEGPNNTINFSSIVGAITSIAVTVDNKTLSSFPYRESINRVYDITVDGAVTSYIATLRLHYETVDLNGNNESIMTLWNDQGTTTWVEIGANSNNTTENWVEETGLTSLEDKWSLSDGLKVVSWTGAVSTLVTDAGNWTVTAGTPSIPPGPDDVIVIGDKSFTNQPTLNVSATIKRIIFESTTESTATVASGTTLTISGNILGDWTGGVAAHTLEVGTANLVVNGDLELSDETSGNTIELTASTGTISVLGSVLQSGGADINFTGAGTLNIGEDYEYTSGTFTPGSSTVAYNGADNQLIAGVTYNHLTIDKSAGLATTAGSVQVNSDLNLTNGELTLGNNLDVDGNLIVASGTTLNAGFSVISLASDFSLDGTFDPGTGIFELDGTGDQDVTTATYNTLRLDKPSGIASLTGDIYLKGNAVVENGTFDAETHSIIRTSNGGFADLGAGGTMLLAGGSTQVQNFANLTIDPASTVHFNGSISRVIPPYEYGHLIFSNGGTKFLFGNTAAAGDVTINSGATLDISDHTFTLGGDLTIDGTFETTNSFLELNGLDNDINGTSDFDEVLVNGSYDYQSGNPTFNGHIEIASTGDFDLGSATVTISGDFTNRGTAVSDGIVTFTGNQAQTVRLLNAISSTSSGVINFNGTVSPVLASTSSPQFATVNINNTAGITPSAPWTVAISMNVASGSSFNAGSLDHTFLGHYVNDGTVTSDGTLTFSPIYFPASITLGSNFTTTGSVTFGGTQAISLTDNTPVFTSITISNVNATGVAAGSVWSVTENMSIAPGATFNAGAYSHTISGDFVNQGTFDGQNSTMTFNGNSGSDIISGTGTSTFNDVIFDTGATLEVVSGVTVTGDFTNNATTLTLSNSTIEFSGNSQSIVSGTSPSFNDLAINKNAIDVRLDMDISIAGTLSMTDGFLDLNGNELSITDSLASAISRTSGFILSESTDNSSKVNWYIGIDTDEHVIPFGNVGGDYIPFSFELASGDAGTVSVSTYPTGNDNTPYPFTVTDLDADGFDNSHNTVDRFYQIDLSGETNPSANIEFTASNTEIGGISGLVAQRWDGVKWEAPLSGQTSTSNSVRVPGVTQFSPWAVSGNGVTLPIELVSFEGNARDYGIRLEWITATEKNNDYFEVHRSRDGVNFELIGTVSGAGDSRSLIEYSFTDNSIFFDGYFYRLKQTDFDGEFEFGPIIWVEIQNELSNFTIFPNPSDGKELNLEFDGFLNKMMSVTIYNELGQVVVAKDIDRNIRHQAIYFPERLDSGLYVVLLSVQGNQFVRKLIVK